MRYSTFDLDLDLDPAADVDEAFERFAQAGWQTWETGRGATITLNGRRVHRVWLRTTRPRPWPHRPPSG